MTRPTTSSLPLEVEQPNKTLETRAQIGPMAVMEPQVQPKQSDEAAMLRLAIDKGASIETIKELVALQRTLLMQRAETEFNEALSRIQSKIKRVAPDLDNPQTRSKYASYAAIDRVIRPIYSEEGFSLSFTEEDCPKPEHVRIVCFVSKGAYTRQYRKDMPADGKGAKGGDVMTKTHAAAAADSYAKRYLVKDIFNVAIGQDDNDGNGANGQKLEPTQVEEFCRQMKEVESVNDLKAVFAKGWGQAQTAGDRASMAELKLAYDIEKKRFANAAR